MLKGNEMDCPRCHTGLSIEKYQGIEVDRCSSCNGMWLEYNELDELEDKAMDDDDVKGSVMFRSYQGRPSLPHLPEWDANVPLSRLRLGDGLLPQRARLLAGQRRGEAGIGDNEAAREGHEALRHAEAEWASMLKRFKSKSFGDRMKGMFRR